MAAEQLQQALHLLVTDASYREEVVRDDQRLLNDFRLSPGELGLLQAIWEAVRGTPEHRSVERGLMLCSWAACCCCFWEGP